MDAGGTLLLAGLGGGLVAYGLVQRKKTRPQNPDHIGAVNVEQLAATHGPWLCPCQLRAVPPPAGHRAPSQS